MTVDPRAARGFAGAVDAYERGRPSYPARAVARLGRELGMTGASTVLDLAAGTGKLTRSLLPRFGGVVAVEPSPAMLARMREELPGVDARAGIAEAIPVADGSVDAVFVGEAFHWFETAAACREIARVLAPGGGLALLWNRARWTVAELPWLTAFEALTKPHRRAAGRFPAEEWKAALEETRLFRALSRAEVDGVQHVDADDFVALVGSWSWIANLPDRRRGALLGQVRVLVGEQRRLRLRYRTELHWTRALRAPAARPAGG